MANRQVPGVQKAGKARRGRHPVAGESCSHCRFAAVCLPIGPDKFFARMKDRLGFRAGMSTSADVMNACVEGVSAFYRLLPDRCPQLEDVIENHEQAY